MPIEPVKIPQNVQIEDRIIGPVPLRQLIVTIIGCGISYAIWSSLQKAFGGVSIPATIVAWIPAVLFLAFAFIKVYDLSLFRIVLLMIERSVKPQTRTWTPRTGISTLHLRASAKTDKKKQSAGIEEQKPPNIEELSAMRDIPQKATPPKTAVPEHATNPTS